MKTKIDSNHYQRCERAFLVELAKTVDIVVERTALQTREEKKALASSLTFAIAAHLSGSSFNGRVAGEEIYPRLGFYRGEKDETLFFGDGSSLHEFVPSVLAELSSTDRLSKQ